MFIFMRISWNQRWVNIYRLFDIEATSLLLAFEYHLNSLNVIVAGVTIVSSLQGSAELSFFLSV